MPPLAPSPGKPPLFLTSVRQLQAMLSGGWSQNRPNQAQAGKRMHRRNFLIAALTAATASRLAADPQTAKPPQSENANASDPQFVESEVAPLQRVLVHPPGPETLRTFPMFSGQHSMLTWELLRPEAAIQHAAFVAQLTRHGTEVLHFERLLEESIERCRANRSMTAWLQSNAPRLVKHEANVTAQSLLGIDDRFVYQRDDSGLLNPATSPTTTLFFTRDLAVMTPRGVVICNFNHDRRAFESALTRFVFQNATILKKYPIAFDAIAEQVYVEGGDVLLADKKTLLIGVGNATQQEAAMRLAKTLEMDVIAVQMPSVEQWPGEWSGLQSIFYHLDCLLNFVDHKRVLAVPYLLEQEHARSNPLLEILIGFSRIERLSRPERIAMLNEVQNVGWITRFQAGSGEPDRTLGKMKILDYLKAQGYEVNYVGGQLPPNGNPFRYTTERVIREARFMAANVVALGPAHLVSYAGNTNTNSDLRSAGIKVDTFAATELMRANGGPHCLTMPLERR